MLKKKKKHTKTKKRVSRKSVRKPFSLILQGIGFQKQLTAAQTFPVLSNFKVFSESIGKTSDCSKDEGCTVAINFESEKVICLQSPGKRKYDTV